MNIVERTDNYLIQQDSDCIIFKDLHTGAAYLIEGIQEQVDFMALHTTATINDVNPESPTFSKTWDQVLTGLFYNDTPKLPGATYIS